MVVRTHALSRRWRGLWTRVAALRFDFDSMRESCSRLEAAAQRYIAFVNGALALCAANRQPAFLEHLTISFDPSPFEEDMATLFSISRHETGQVIPLSLEAAQGWIRYAVQHAVKSFTLRLRLPIGMDRDDNVIEHYVITLDEMDDYASMETMHLRLGKAELRLPSSAVLFLSLIDLSLEDLELPAGSGDLLSRLVSSSCCPCLHKLQLQHLSFEHLEVLHIEADTLLELSIEAIYELQLLELRTPSLQILHIVNCFNLNGFTISAPRLEKFECQVQQPLHINDIHGHLSSVEALEIEMFSHEETELHQCKNAAAIHLLQCCWARCLEVSFKIPKTKDQTMDIIRGRIPLLPYVTHLAVHINLREPHSTGPGIECLLAQCRNIKYLSLQLDNSETKWSLLQRNLSELDLLCDNSSCHWKSHEFSLDYLEKVEFKKLMGTDCESSLFNPY